MVVSLGGSCALYVFEHEESVVRRLAAFLQTTDFAGVIFSGLEVEGTFPLSQVHLAATNGAPDLVVSMRWSDELNEHGVRGTVAAPEGKRGLGTHASLSRYDLHNTLIAAGPDFKTGFMSETPSGNIDVVPTVLYLLGVTPSTQLDGRVLSEALLSDGPPTPKPIQDEFEASRDLGLLSWRQYSEDYARRLFHLLRRGKRPSYAESEEQARGFRLQAGNWAIGRVDFVSHFDPALRACLKFVAAEARRRIRSS